MESRVKAKLLSVVVTLTMAASMGASQAASPKPSPRPTASHKLVVKKTPVLVVPKKSAPAKTAVSKKVAAKKVVPKKTATKKTAVKKSPPRKANTTVKRATTKPTPKPVWPPKGFIQGTAENSEIFYRIPTEQELGLLVSVDSSLAAQIQRCLPTKFACGVVRVASANGCLWWEFNSNVQGPLSTTDSSLVPIGNLHTTVQGTSAKQIITALLVSAEPFKQNVSVTLSDISCHHAPATEKVPVNLYTLVTPVPSDTPTTNTN